MKSFIVAVMVVAMISNLVVEGQDIPDIPVCVANLLSCVPYLNTTTIPSVTCCIPLQEAINDQLPCLCNIYNDPALLVSLGINVTQAIALPARCGINFSITECTGAQPPYSPMPQPGTPNSPTNPSAPSPSSAGQSATATISCLFILAAAVLYWA